MAEKKQSKKSRTTSVADLTFPEVSAENSPREHPPRSYDPRVVDDHFRSLIKNPPSAEERARKKQGMKPFPGL